MDFSSSKPAEVPKQDLAGLMEAAQKDLFGYLETPPVTSDDSNHLKQIPNAPTKVPAQNQYVNEPPTSETGPLNPLIPENNVFLNVLKFLPTMNNAKPEESYPIQPSDSVLQISPEKGLHWVHRSEIAQINMPPIDPALVQNLLDQFRASNS
ncbi:hypothetical protein L3Y34_019788 [Caenorhabditis briggsae]|uniref:Uncharacterized protein n=1 Tax=Caenorhabditis briggsae TaxID=6238 RepID=A0AAE9DQ87_CAEBR|nr:hypothetical protein L3Y34_019788 [Caenorhabditis briggsae]